MGNMTLMLPPFPELIWRDGVWESRDVFPSWSRFRLSHRGEEFVDHLVEGADTNARSPLVRVEVESDDMEEGQPRQPTEAQRAAYEYLKANDAHVANAILSSIFDEYPEQRRAAIEALGELEDELPEIDTPQQLGTLLQLLAVHILAVEHEGVAYAGFEFACAWEEEHGHGVMLHRGRIVATGHADTAFVDWKATEDRDRR